MMKKGTGSEGNIDPFTIVVIVLALVFAFVIIYFSGVLVETYPDVVHERYTEEYERWSKNDDDLRPYIAYHSGYQPDSQWILYYLPITGYWTFMY
jgi:hypothetical protein